MYSVVIHTCDKYEFCWKSFLHYFQENWTDKDCKVYFVNERVDVDLPEGITQLKTGLGSWSNRLKIALKQIDTTDIFYIQEDMWILKPVDVAKHYDIFKKLDADVLRLSDCRLYKKSPVFGHIYKMETDSGYLVSHQPSFWKRDLFLSILGDNESPWTNEINGTKKLRKMEKDLYIAKIDDWYRAVCRGGRVIDKFKDLIIE